MTSRAEIRGMNSMQHPSDRFTRKARTGKARILAALIFVALMFGGLLHAQAPNPVVGQSSTLLPDGRILLIGGLDSHSKPTGATYIVDSQQHVTSVGPLQVARAGHTATLLPDGTVFIFGGFGTDGHVVQTSELFAPATQTIVALTDVLAVPRAYHTATVLTDGSLLLAGGVEAGGQFPEDVQLWDFRTKHALSFQAVMMTARQGHSATLLSDGTVRISGGTDKFGRPVPADEIYDPVSKRFSFASQGANNGQSAAGALQIMASMPQDGAENVPLDQLVSVRFSHLLNVPGVSTANFVLLDPNQTAIASTVTPNENGRLVFVVPQSPLQSGTLYTLQMSNVLGADGERLPDSFITFQTAGEPSENGNGDGSPQGPSTTTTQWQQLRPLQAPPNVTALAGQALKLTGWPLANVTLELEGDSGAPSNKTRTDDTGRFLLEGISPGRHVLWIDGGTANHDKITYGIFEVGVTILPGKTNVLNYTIWMTPLDTAHTVRIPSPTTAETVITNATLPGLELHLPASTVITDRNGKVVRELSITAIPLNKPPFPLPAGVPVPLYFTVQPGGGYVQVLKPGNGPQGARLIYPNMSKLAPGTPFDFWDYDADVKGWFIYGEGHVTPDSLSIVPDPGVVVYEFTGAMVGSSSGAPGIGPPAGPKKVAGDPVDLSTGQFTYDKTDLTVSDIIPITLTRTYVANDSRSRSFGIGAMHNYDIFTVGDINPYTYQELILPNGSRVRFDRISPGTSWLDTLYVATTSGGAYYGARMSWVANSSDPNGGHWKLVMKDGTVLTFPEAAGSTNPFCQALTSITDRYGNTVKLSRNANCNLTKITSPNGRYINLTNDSQGRIIQAQDNIGRTVAYAYDAAGRLSTVTDANSGVTTYTYDDQNRMLTIQDPRNIVYLSNQYDSSGRVIQQTQADNGTYLFAWTPANTAQTHFFITTGAGGGGGGGTSVLMGNGCWGNNGYNRYSSACGEGYLPLVAQVDVTDPRGYVRRLVFGSAGYATTDTHALGQPEQQTVTYAYYADNTLQSATDALGRITSFDYDANGNTTRVTRLDGTANPVTTTFTYEPQFNHLASVTDPLGHSSTFQYDQNGNLVTAADRLNHQTTFAYNSAGQNTSITDELNNSVQFGYLGGDLVSVTDPLGNASTKVTDAVGRTTSATDPQGNTVTTQYNALNLVTQVTDALGNKTSFTYDGNGNLLSLSDVQNHATNWTYDNMDRPLTRTDALNRQESYIYDLKGNLASSTNRKGQVTSVTYDGLNRSTFVGYNTTTNGGVTSYESTISYTYDAGNRMAQVVDTAGGTITEAYDNLDRLTSETTAQGAISYGYDNAGRRTNMTVTGQPQVDYSYDNADRLTQITQGSSTVSFSYDNVNRRTSLTLPNGVSVAYGYDSNSRITGITYIFGANTLGNLTYSYDQLGRKTQVGGSFARTNLPGAITSATYDAANQLINWNGTGISYDANGNMQSDGTNSFTWNARNQVASLNGASLQYDAFGRRIKNASGTSFLFDGANSTQELSGSTVTANIWSGGLDELFQRVDSNGTVVPLADGLGSTIALVDSTDNIKTTYSYDPFGNTTASGVANANPSQYAGRENEGNGLYFYRARYYSSLLGRFVNEDPLGFAGSGPNSYAYVGDNPVGMTDPSGMSWACPSFMPSCPDYQSESDAMILAGRKQRRAYWKGFFKELTQGDWTAGTGGKELCFVTFIKSTAEALNPLDFSVDNPKDWVELGQKVASLSLNNLAFIHAATATNVLGGVGLISPYKSSIVRGLTEAAEGLEEAAPALAFDVAAATKGLPDEWDAFKGGRCEASF